MNIFVSFIVSMLACIGFCILINIPRRSILIASAIGGFGWVLYEYILASGSTKSMAAFLGACIVTLLSEICSRYFKEAATIFVIPGIIPLVPGAGMYYTMISIIDSNYESAANIGRETFFIAGSIALALLVVGSLVRVFNSFIKKI